MRKIKRILAVALSAATLFSLTACEKEESAATGEWTVETVYAKAQELGFEGTWEEFKEQMRGAQGVGIGDVSVSADGDLIVTLTSGKRINCGKVRLGACDHSYGAWQTGAEATCESIGYKMRACSSCGNVEYAFEAAKGHEWISAADVYENVYVCETCGLLKYSEDVPSDEPENPDDSVDSTKSVLRINVFGGAYGYEWVNEAVDRFEDVYKDVSFEAGKKGVKVFIDVDKMSVAERAVKIPYEDYDLYITYAKEGQFASGIRSGYIKDITGALNEPLTYFGETETIQQKLTRPTVTYNQKTYAMPYLADAYGILYNRGMFNKYEYEVPNTTDELIALCEEMLQNGHTPFTGDSGATISYSETLLNVWWAQYQGMDGYDDFWNGIDNGRYSKNIFSQEGRLEALKAYEQLTLYENGYFNKRMMANSFIASQTEFLLGEYRQNQDAYPMIICGEWMMEEMTGVLEAIQDSYGTTPDIGMMRTPVLSSIVETLEDTTMTDETLSAVVAAIDGGATSYTGVSASDFQKIKVARGITEEIRHYFFVNSNVNAVEEALACEFMQFMSCDQALTEVAKYNMRSALSIDLPQEVYDGMSSVKKQAYDFAKTATPLPDVSGMPTVFYGGLSAWNPQYRPFNVFWNKGSQMTAQRLFEETIAYWTDSKFQQMLELAGLL